MNRTFSILPEPEYEAEYGKGFEKLDVPTDADKDRIRVAIRTTQQLIVEQLESKWKTEDDFEVGFDFDYCYHVCGGIYSDRIISPTHLEAIASALAAAPEPTKWTYHTSCEAENVDGEFFIRNGVVFLPETSPDDLLAKLNAKS